MQCGYCYGHGHNKMGCPKAKEKADAVLPQWEEWQNMEHDNGWFKTSIHRASRHFDWPYKAAEALEIHLHKQKRSRKVKVCNFCGEAGHNKRTCQELKDFKAKLKQGSIGYRKAVLDAISKTGQGIGAMFQGEYSHWNPNKGEWDEGNGIGLITHINWGMISLFDVEQHGEITLKTGISSQVFLARWVHGQKEGITPMVGYDIGAETLLHCGWRGATKTLIAPSTKVNPPDGWAECEDDAFKKHLSSALSGRKSQKKSHFNRYQLDKIQKWKEFGQKNVLDKLREQVILYTSLKKWRSDERPSYNKTNQSPAQRLGRILSTQAGCPPRS